MRSVLAAVAPGMLAVGIAGAFPDGAPWGAANPAAEQNCATCHFDYDPVFDSPALTIDGLPADPQAGEIYGLRISFDDPAIVVAGFQMFAQMTGEQAGLLVSDSASVDFIGSAIRSTAPATKDGGVTWLVKWYAPRIARVPDRFLPRRLRL